MRPVKIISGGQTGADQGGLEAARMLGIPTGGTAPPGYVTDDGPNYLLSSFGLKEGEPDPKTYPKRTYKNVKDSDGTVLFGNLNSPGTRLTIKYCNTLLKPYIENPSPWALNDWTTVTSTRILNVAGNRERKNPGIKDRVIKTLLEAFKE